MRYFGNYSFPPPCQARSKNLSVRGWEYVKKMLVSVDAWRASARVTVPWVNLVKGICYFSSNNTSVLMTMGFRGDCSFVNVFYTVNHDGSNSFDGPP